MKAIQRDVVLLLKSSITGEKYKLSETFEIENITELVKNHAMIPLIFTGALNCGISQNDPVMKKMLQGYVQALYQHENQSYELNRIYEAFERHKIHYMPVKGCRMKTLYPKPEMRIMGDADILIETHQYPEIETIMNDLGFRFVAEEDHDYIWTSESLYLELHYLLMYAYNEEYEEYFGNGWKLAEFQEGYQFRMSCEDEFIYLFIHFTKHYRMGGIGCRHVVDLWIYLLKHKNLDTKYIENIMKKLSVYSFYKNTLHMINTWFNDGEEDDITELMTQYIFNSGSWGTVESTAIARGVKAKQTGGTDTKGRMKVVREALFPPLDLLQHRYRILKKNPYLLPFIWIYRWIDASVFRKDNVSIYKNRVRTILKNDLSEYEDNLTKVGLNFTFDKDG